MLTDEFLQRINQRLMRRLRRGWWWLHDSYLEDAAQEALLDLAVKWVHWESSHADGDPDKQFNYALTRATHIANHYLVRYTNTVIAKEITLDSLE